MATATTNTSASNQTSDFTQLGIDLEKLELESGVSHCSIQTYSQLLGVYLLQNDLCNAKLLWKRIPTSLKQTSQELGSIWDVGQKMWLRDYAGTYDGLKKEWSDEINVLMVAVLESVRKRGLQLVKKAYSSISAENFCQFLGISSEEAIKVAKAEGWHVDEHNIISPRKSDFSPVTAILSDQHLSVLTEYVTFMEN